MRKARLWKYFQDNVAGFSLLGPVVCQELERNARVLKYSITFLCWLGI